MRDAPELSKKTKVSDLSDDNLCLIFSKISDTRTLCFVTEVCRRWRAVCLSDGSIWQKLSLLPPKEPYSAYIKKPKVTKLRRLDHAFKALSTKRSKPGMKTAVEFMTSRSKKLRRLDLRHVRPGVKKAVLEDLKKIEDRAATSLNALLLNGAQFNVTPAGLKDSLAAFPHLRVLHASNFEDMTLNVLSAITARCRRLEDIDVSDSPRFRGIGSAVGVVLFSVRRTLRRIDVSGTKVSSLPLLDFGTEFPVLDEIRADNCSRLRQSLLLQHVDVDNAAAALFPCLTYFSVNHSVSFCSRWVSILLRKTRQLEYLGLSFSRPDPPSNLSFENNTSLRVLALAGQHLADEDLQLIYNVLRKSLEHLNVRSNILLTGFFMADYAGGEGFPNLVSLDASLTRFSDDAVRRIIALSPKLETFVLEQCRSVRNFQLRRNPCRCVRDKLTSPVNPSSEGSKK